MNGTNQMNIKDKNPPCKYCYGACCRQSGGHKFAVLLEPEEADLFPECQPFSNAADCIENAFVLPYIEGKCIHLGDDNRCKIYNNRPQGCRDFSCLNGYKSRPDGSHGFFLEDNPKVVKLIKIHILNASVP